MDWMGEGRFSGEAGERPSLLPPGQRKGFSLFYLLKSGIFSKLEKILQKVSFFLALRS